MKNFFLKSNLFYFFYKIFKIFRNSKKSKHLGEFGEDIFVRRFFKKKAKGFYVDVGCYHPIKGSLTNSLYKKGWNGMNIDLSEISIDLFKLSRPNDHNINAAITNFDGKTSYYENSPINQQNSLEDNDGIKKEIEAYKLNTLLEKNKIEKIDYLNIDAEGNDYKVISNFNFTKYEPQLISIEFNSYDMEKLINSEIHKCMTENSYKLISKFGVTCFYSNEKDFENINKLMSV